MGKRNINLYFDDSVLVLIDNFRFGNRIASRAEAVRKLVESSLALGYEDWSNDAPIMLNDPVVDVPKRRVRPLKVVVPEPVVPEPVVVARPHLTPPPPGGIPRQDLVQDGVD